MASVRVAVRVRPMSKREEDLSSKCIIHTEGKKTSISNPKFHKGFSGNSLQKNTKTFSFDFSYDSTNCKSANYVSQEKIFKDLGSDILLAAFQGYNACIFAYGQTGSGKSFTMMGSPEDRGLIPRICEGMFARIARMTLWDEASFCTKVSYLEIYNERIRDLLRKNSSHAYNLRVREHPKGGPYVEDLSKHLVQTYSDVEELMEKGKAKRTMATTAMNSVSSRSHTIFTINFTQANMLLLQAKFGAEMPCETVSKIHLVDLAGSERAHVSGSSGVRLKEGGSINKSLTTLGNVISALADHSEKASTNVKKRHVFVHYRDSVLTWLLKDSLGGNSKTIMIATVSPADVNYRETLSTLCYANRAKNIVNKPTVNEDPNVKLLRELRAEVARLKELLAQGTQVSCLDSPTALSMEKKLHENEARVLELTEEWANKWSETQNILKEEAVALRKEGIAVILDSQLPHLIGIDDDLLSTGIFLYYLKEGGTCAGREDAKVEQDIILHGPGLESEHCVFENRNDSVTLVPFGGSQCLVNGIQVVEPYQLSQGAVILLGRMNMFRFNNPKEAAKLREKRKRASLSTLSSSMTDVSKSSENLSTLMLYNSGKIFLCYSPPPPPSLGSFLLSKLGGRRAHPLGEQQTSGDSRPAAGPNLYVPGMWPFADYRLISNIEENVQRRLDENQTENIKLSENLKRMRSPECDTNPLKLTHVNCTEVPHIVQCGGAVISSGEISSADEKTTEGFVEKLSPEESVCVNHVERGHLCKEVETLTGAKMEKEVDVSPHKSDRLEMLAELPPKKNGHRVLLHREWDGAEDDAGQSEASGGAAGNNQDKGESNVGPHALTGDLGKGLCGVALPLTLSVCQADGGSTTKRAVGQEPSQVPVPNRGLPNAPLAEIAVEGQLADPGTRKVSVEGYVEPVQGAVSEPEIVHQCECDGDGQSQSFGYKLAGKLSWLYQVARSHLHSTKQVICQIVELNHLHKSSWYKQIYMIVKHLPVCQNVHLKVTVKSATREAAQLSGSLRNYLNYIKERSHVQSALGITWSPRSSVTVSQDLQVFCQKLVEFPLCLQELQSLTPQRLLAHLNRLIPDTIPNSQLLLGIYWLHLANNWQPVPQPGCVLLFEFVICAVVCKCDLQEEESTLAILQQLQSQQIREIHVGFAGQHVRVLGATEDTIFTIYTYNKQLTQELCQALLKALSPEVLELSATHPLLRGDLMELSLDWKAHMPDLCLSSRLQLSSQFKRVLADLVYFLHGNMKEKPSLADVHLLLYTSVRVEVSPYPRPHSISCLLLTDTHVGLVQEEGVFHPVPRAFSLTPQRPHFEQIALRRLSEIRCILVGDKDSSVTMDVVFRSTGVRNQECKHQGKNKTVLPCLSHYNLFPKSEVWKLTFGCTAEAAFVINHLSAV
ncbi:uncharacterized protein LOC108933606 [Arapaima gigas]